MANIAGGRILWQLDADSTKFNAALIAASARAKAFEASIANASLSGIGSMASLSRSISAVNFGQLAINAQQSFGGIASGIENTARKIGLLTVGGGALGTVFLKSAADLQTTSKSFQVLIGNADRANQLFAQIKRFADTTPFQFPELADSARVLLGFGVGVDDVFSRLKVLGDISAVTGADLKSLAVVFGQVTGAGRLMGQDALQLVNNNIPITTILTKKLGISAAELRKQIENGAISSQIFTEALTSITQEGGIAFRGTDELAKTFNGRLSTLKDTALEFGRNLLGVKVDPELGLTVEPGGVFDRLSKALPRITDSLKDLGPRIKGAFDFLIRNADTVKAVLIGVAAGFVAAKIAFIAFSIAAAINPIGLIAVAIVALIAGLTFLQVKFGIFTKTFQALKPILDPIVGAFRTIFRILGEQLSPIIDFVNRNLEVFKIIAITLIGLALLPLVIAIGAVLGAIAALVLFVIGLIGIFKLLVSVVVGVSKAIAETFVGLFNGVATGISSVITFFKELPGKILGALGNMGNILLNAGKDLITGFINGIKGKFNDVKDTLGNLTDKLTSWKGPASLDRKILMGSGRLVIQGFITGLESQFGAVQSSLGGLTTNLTPGQTMSPSILQDEGGRSALDRSGRVEQNNTFNVYNQVDLTQGLRDLAWQLGN